MLNFHVYITVLACLLASAYALPAGMNLNIFHARAPVAEAEPVDAAFLERRLDDIAKFKKYFETRSPEPEAQPVGDSLWTRMSHGVLQSRSRTGGSRPGGSHSGGGGIKPPKAPCIIPYLPGVEPGPWPCPPEDEWQDWSK